MWVAADGTITVRSANTSAAVDIEYDLSDVEYSVVIDPNGFLTEVRMSCVMNMDMTVQGQKAASTSTISATSKILDVGKAVTITIPEV